MEYLFVYGTLLSDVKHQVLGQIKGELTFISKASVNGALYNLGVYPGYVNTEAGQVNGELYEVHNTRAVFEILDEYEGLFDEDPEYSRKIEIVTLPDGKQVKSWVYVFTQQLRPEHKKIIGGDYIAFIRNKVGK